MSGSPLALFTPGTIVATDGALEAFEQEGANPYSLLARHLQGDWGDMCAEDKELNTESLAQKGRLHSAYKLPKTGEEIWIITDWGWEVTTLLLPSEY